jgi:transposase
MHRYPESAVERAMKVQEVLLRAMSGQISWVQAGEILGLCPRQVLRLRQRFQDDGYSGLFDRRRQPSPKRVPLEQVEEVLRLYREQYADFNVQHFHETLRDAHKIVLSYSWVKKALQTAGLVPVSKRRGAHRRRRERRPLPGMLLHIDASRHAWVPGGMQDLVSVSDDARSTAGSSIAVHGIRRRVDRSTLGRCPGPARRSNATSGRAQSSPR